MFVCPECGQSYERAGHCTADGARLADGATDSLLGKTIGSYRVARLIGAGGMGAVYKGVQPSIGSRVAIKVLSHDPARSQTLVERFFSEARAINVIRHEHIVNVLDLSALPDGRPYIVMEYLDGEPLSSLLERCRAPLGTRSAGRVLDALSAAHAKASCTAGGGRCCHAQRAQVLIPGSRSCAADRDAGLSTHCARCSYSAAVAEQALAGRRRAPDVYALGVILFEAATSKRPFEADRSTSYGCSSAAPSAPRSLRRTCPQHTTVIRGAQKDRRSLSVTSSSPKRGRSAFRQSRLVRLSVSQGRTASMTAAARPQPAPIAIGVRVRGHTPAGRQWPGATPRRLPCSRCGRRNHNRRAHELGWARRCSLRSAACCSSALPCWSCCSAVRNVSTRPRESRASRRSSPRIRGVPSPFAEPDTAQSPTGAKMFDP
jgi:serine/threonine-protein kinase